MGQNSARKTRRFLAVVFCLIAIQFSTIATAGEFKISRYIEPNQMSKLFANHVRKGIIKRIDLSDGQLQQIRVEVDPYRETLLAQVSEVKNARIDLVRSITGASIDQDQLRAAHTKAAAAELELTLTVAAVIGKLRPLLTEDQLVEVAEMMEEVRTASELRFAYTAEQFAAGELLVRKPTAKSRWK